MIKLLHVVRRGKKQQRKTKREIPMSMRKLCLLFPQS